MLSVPQLLLISASFCVLNTSQADWFVSTAQPSLTVRAAPEVTAKKIGSIPPNGKVNVIANTGKKDSISGYSGEWVKVEWLTGQGYVFNSTLKPMTADTKPSPIKPAPSDATELEKTLLNAIKKNKNNEHRDTLYGPALRAYKQQGFINEKPNGRADYTDYYLLKKPATFLGHELVVLEEEYMSAYIGCCVSPGLGLSVKVKDSLANLETLARANGCQVEDKVSLTADLANYGIKNALKAGHYASLSCRERDDQ